MTNAPNKFNISNEKNKMRQTNFSVGKMRSGYDSVYLN